MVTREVRFDMKVISANALASYMKSRGYSVRSLADEAGREWRRRSKDSTKSVSHSTIGHLRNPRSGRSFCDNDLALIIEDLLNAPRGSLFMPTLTTVQRERGQVA